MHAKELLILSGIGLVSFALTFNGAAVGMVLGHLRLPLLVAYLGSPVSGASTVAAGTRVDHRAARLADDDGRIVEGDSAS